MRWRFAMALVLVVAFGALSSGREVAGVDFPDRAQVGNHSLVLQGAGVRKKAMFKVYAAGLYLEQPTRDPQTAATSDQTKRVQMFMLRNLERGKITEAIETGFRRNVAPAALPGLHDRLERFVAAIPDLQDGETLTVTYVPGTGTILESPKQRMVIPGKDFADGLFSVWLGAHPVDEELRESLVGR